MTRRGTLSYYLAAWVIGCFVVSLLQWIGEALAGEIHTASILLTAYFFSLAFGAVAILLFALLLRRSMRLLGTHALWIWFLSGAILSLVEIFALIRAQSALLSIRSGEFGEIFPLCCGAGCSRCPGRTQFLAGARGWSAHRDRSMSGGPG